MSNKRFVTTWTSEDAVDWRMYIIPSSANYSSGSVDVALPSDFLLREMEHETELGSIPSGMVTSSLRLSVNLASLIDNADLNLLRTDLLKGTSQTRLPVSSSGVDIIGNADGWYKSAEVVSAKSFDAFNTFILQYNDGSGYKTSFIGCQKYSAENELEITPLQNLIRYDIEVFDVVRCIGEMIQPVLWEYFLRATADNVQYSAIEAYPENREYRDILLKGYLKKSGSYNIVMAQDILPSELYFHMSSFERLTAKITAMYSSYLRAITQNNSSSFTCNQFYKNAIQFYTSWKNNGSPIGDASTYRLCYIAEVWEVTTNNKLLASGAHADSTMFGKFQNFHEVYKNIIEGMLEIVRFEYSHTNGSPDSYSITGVASNPYPATDANTVTFSRANTFDSFKIKLLSETLKNAKVNVTSITGAEDTSSYEYSEQATEADNSKDMEVMFHNYTMVTDRTQETNQTAGGDVEWVSDIKWYRNTLNPGTLVYGQSDIEISFIFGSGVRPLKVMNKVRITFGAEYLDIDYQLPSPWINAAELGIVLEQQNGGSGYGAASALVNFYGRRTQAEAELKTIFTTIKSADVGKRCIVNLADYNTLLYPIYSANTARAVVYKHQHSIYEGTVELSIRIDGESA